MSMETGQETLENVVATVIDLVSMFVAYQMGFAQLGIATGLGYAVLDALVVIWMRKPITRAIRSAVALGGLGIGRRPQDLAFHLE